MFGKIKSVDWVSKINLSNNREEISSCFQDTKLNISYPKDLNEFNAFIENFKRETDNNDDNDNDDNEILVKKINKLIVMDDVSGLADKSNDFGSFLTIIYLFHILYSSKFNWEMIIS